MTAPLMSILALAAALLACSSSKRSSDDQLARPDDNAITTILKEDGFYSTALESPLTTIVNTREDFAALWSQIFAEQSPVPPVPEVDFTRESVVLATPGLKSSGGHGVSIESLEEIPEGMRLVITAVSPGASCVTTEALTTPVHIARTRKLPAVVMFDWRARTIECD